MFSVTYDQRFPEVIRSCQQIQRPGQAGTWITDEMRAAYTQLHTLGYAHSVEVWQDDTLVGGLYGLLIGSVFFGESMFSFADNASKVSFITVVRQLREQGCTLIDCQVHTPHLARWGAEDIRREEYMQLLNHGLQYPTTWPVTEPK